MIKTICTEQNWPILIRYWPILLANFIFLSAIYSFIAQNLLANKAYTGVPVQSQCQFLWIISVRLSKFNGVSVYTTRNNMQCATYRNYSKMTFTNKTSHAVLYQLYHTSHTVQKAQHNALHANTNGCVSCILSLPPPQALSLQCLLVLINLPKQGSP